MAKPLTGSIRKNDKQGIETRPDYRGKITMLDGIEYWVSGWINEDNETGQKYLSLKLQPKDQQAFSGSIVQHNKHKENVYEPQIADDDIPF